MRTRRKKISSELELLSDLTKNFLTQAHTFKSCLVYAHFSRKLIFQLVHFMMRALKETEAFKLKNRTVFLALAAILD